MEQIKKSKKEWKELLTPEQYYVLREKGTEPAFTGKSNNDEKEGTYLCAGCGQELFSSDTKYESGSGWPSFWEPISEDKIERKDDDSFFMHRIEVICSHCASHLGHVFDDGPKPTGERFCMNSIALIFKKKE